MVRIGPGSGVGGAAGGGDESSGGGDSGGSTAPDNDAGRVAPDPVDGGGSNDSGGSSGGSSPGVVDRVTSTVDSRVDGFTNALRNAGQTYTERVAEPAGDFTADTNPVARTEQAVLGTDRIASVSEGVGQGVAQLGNVPGNTASAISAAGTAATARSRGYDQLTIAGRPTGVIVPDPDGQAQNARDATSAGAAAAAGASQQPFETTGELLGGAIGGVAASRGLQTVARRSGSASGATSGSGGSLGSSPSDVLDDFLDDTRATTTGRQRPDTDSDTTRFDGSGVQSGSDFEADLRQQDLTQRQDILREQATREQSVQRGVLDDADGGDPLGTSGRGPTFDPDQPDVAGPSRQTQTPGQAVPPEFSGLGRRGNVPTQDLRSTVDVGGASSTSSAGTAAGLGTLSTANDPTGIADFDGQQRGATAGGTLTASETADRLAEELGLGGPSDVGGDDGVADATATSTTTTTGTADIGLADTGGDTATTGGSSTGATNTAAPIEDLRASTRVAPQSRTGATSGSGVSAAQLTDPSTATDIGQASTAGGLGGGGGGGGGNVRRRPDEEADEDDDRAAAILGVQQDSDVFGSGFTSGAEALEDIVGR